MNTVWHEHFFVPGHGEGDRVDAVEYEDRSVYVIVFRDGKVVQTARCLTRGSATKAARRLAGRQAPRGARSAIARACGPG